MSQDAITGLQVGCNLIRSRRPNSKACLVYAHHLRRCAYVRSGTSSLEFDDNRIVRGTNLRRWTTGHGPLFRQTAAIHQAGGPRTRTSSNGRDPGAINLKSYANMVHATRASKQTSLGFSPLVVERNFGGKNWKDRAG